MLQEKMLDSSYWPLRVRMCILSNRFMFNCCQHTAYTNCTKRIPGAEQLRTHITLLMFRCTLFPTVEFLMKWLEVFVIINDCNQWNYIKFNLSDWMCIGFALVIFLAGNSLYCRILGVQPFFSKFVFSGNLPLQFQKCQKSTA